jgi:membrane-bound lytic murein transglycosylase D
MRMSDHSQSASFLCKAFLILLLAAPVCSSQSFAQTTDNQIDKNRMSRLKRMSDSISITQHYDVALALFQDFMGLIYPIEIKSAGQENAITDAIEAIDKDLIFKPLPNVIHYEDEDVVYDYIPRPTEGLIAQRFSCINLQMPLTLNERVYEFVDFFTIRRREYIMRMLAKKNIYFPIFEKHLAAYGLPDELKYLSIIESALNPRAISRAGAGGLWQFMPATGRMYGLKQNAFIDERFDPEKATEAACKYLKSLYNFFGGDWELALAAYNCGPGNIQKAIRRSGGKRNFWAIYNFLPKETRAYVPIFTAIVYAMNYAEEHNLVQDQPYFAIDYDVISINNYVPLRNIAEKLNVCLEDLEELNPELKRGIVPGTAAWAYPLRIPAERMDYFADNYEAIVKPGKGNTQVRYVAELTRPSRRVAITTHKVRSGESLSTIAQKYGISVNNLKKWNNLRSDHIQAGKNLKVTAPVGDTEHRPVPATSSTTVIASNKPLPAEKSQPVVAKSTSAKNVVAQNTGNNSGVHIVDNGDTLWGIAKRYNMSVEQLKKLNNIKDNKLTLGQKIVVR